MTRKSDSGGTTEGSLLVFVLLLLITGLALTFLAKTRIGAPADAINLNQASGEELALALEIDPELAGLLVRHREKLGGFTNVRQPAQLSLFPDSNKRDLAKTALTESHLDVNTASAREFESTVGVTRLVARRIINYRDNLPGGRFAKSADALRVPIADDRVIAGLGSRLIVRRPAEVFGSALFYGGSLVLLFLLVPIVIRRSGVGGDPFLIPLALLLSSIGVLTLFSLRDPLREPLEFTHHARGLWLGLSALLLGALIPARPGRIAWLPARSNFRRYTYVWALAAMLLTLALWRLGSGPEGVRLSLGFFQPVEIIKILLMLFVAGYLSERGEVLADALHRWRPKGAPAAFKGVSMPRREDLAPLLGMFGAALVLFLIIHDMGPALLLFGAFLVTFYVATGRAGIGLIGLILLGIAGWIAYRAHFGVIPVRVEMWRMPWDNPHPNGMQLGQGMWAMASGGLWGSGLGLGAPGSIPRGRDDLVFSAMGEELGLIGALAVLVIYALLFARGMRIALHAQNDFDRLLAAGLTALLGCQAFLIIAGVTGLLPLTGITLPFVSYGNTSLVADFFMLGMLRGISATVEPVRQVQPVRQARQFRRMVTLAGFGFFGLIGVARLFPIQAISADEIAGRLIRTPDADGKRRAKVNPRLLSLERALTRGSIYDRSGRVLATSRLDEIAKAMPDDQEAARRSFRKGRFYPRGAATAHLVGYLDSAIGGPVGIEREFQRELRGFADYSELLADYRAKDLPAIFSGHKSRRGLDLTLTIDADLQENIARVLKHAAGGLRDKRNGRPKDRAAMVIVDPLTGEILAAVSLPAFDPNSLTVKKWNAIVANQDQSFRLVDRSRDGFYPPGSSLKVAIAAAGMEEGLDPEIVCNHVATDLRWTYGGRVYARKQLTDDKGDPPHGRIKMPRALKVSCNLYFANLGIQLGADRLHRALADRFELRNVKPVGNFAVDLAQNSFGQGTMLASPLEMARIAASIANQGRMMKPLLAKDLKDLRGEIVKRFTPSLLGRPVGEENAKRIAEMMRGVVTEGTARGVFSSLPVEVAGKTGTAQTEQGDREPHSWFIGFTPYSRPKYAFACVIENGGYGKQGAAPAVNRVLQTLFK